MKTDRHQARKLGSDLEDSSPAWLSAPLSGGVDRRLSGEEGLVWDSPSDEDPALRRELTERFFRGMGEKEPFDSMGDEGGEEVVVDSELHFGSGDTCLNTMAMAMEYYDKTLEHNSRGRQQCCPVGKFPRECPNFVV